jgi:hypothetical protein
MPLILNRGRGILRINPTDSEQIECSTDGGKYWFKVFPGSIHVGTFHELSGNGRRITATTSAGLFYSPNEGTNWYHH